MLVSFGFCLATINYKNTLMRKNAQAYCLNKAIRLTTPSDETYTNLYQGLADCYNLAQNPKNKYKRYWNSTNTIKQPPAFIYYWPHLPRRIGRYEQSQKYLEMFMATRPENKPKKKIRKEQSVPLFIT